MSESYPVRLRRRPAVSAFLRNASRAASLALVWICALHGTLAWAVDAGSPLGLWKTFDDKTGSARAIVRIYEQDGKFFGRIERSFTAGAEKRVCEVCTDDRKDQPIIGLLIIRNIVARDGEYSGGDILDPENGAVYRCKFHLDQNGTRLVVRGYIGFSLLGRTQFWQRQESL